jgi:tetrahydromethanopterin S-methyltransferase subunit G
MQENNELMEFNRHLTDAEIAWAIRYLDPDLCAQRAGKDAGRLVGICIILITGLTGALSYICLYMRRF